MSSPQQDQSTYAPPRKESTGSQYASQRSSISGLPPQSVLSGSAGQSQMQGGVERALSPIPGVPMDNLPPLPEGISLEHLASYGSAGLEMAIRMGMGIGMGLGQQANAVGSSAVLPQQQSAPGAWDASQVQHHLAEFIATQLKSPMVSSGHAGKEGKEGKEGKDAANAAGQIVNGILNDDFFPPGRQSTTPGTTPGLAGVTSFPTSRRTSQSGDLPLSPILGSPSGVESPSPPEELARRDPLAAQVWKAYAKAKGGLPNGPRMENITWRLMHMTLKKTEQTKSNDTPLNKVQEEDEREEGKDAVGAMGEEEERGRRGRFKGKGRVVGFNAESPQGHQDE